MHSPPCQTWRITETSRRLLYNILRCPEEFLILLRTATETDAWKHSGSHNTQSIKMYETVLAQCSPICNHSFQVVCRGLWLVFQVSTTDPLQHSLTRTWMGANTSSLELQLVDQMAQLVPFGRKSRRGSQTHLLNKICFNIVSTKNMSWPKLLKDFVKTSSTPWKDSCSLGAFLLGTKTPTHWSPWDYHGWEGDPVGAAGILRLAAQSPSWQHYQTEGLWEITT